MNKKEALAFRRKIEKAAESQSDADAMESIDLFPKWEDKLPKPGQLQGEKVKVGERLQDGGKLWKVLQTHYVQADWRPGSVPALFTEVSVDEWPEIPETITAENPWMNGMKGTWKGQHYICNMNNCVWNPDVLPSAWDIQP